MRDKCVGGTCGACYVRGEYFSKALPRGCFCRGLKVGSDNGVVDEHVEAAVFGAHFGGSCGDGFVGSPV